MSLSGWVSRYADRKVSAIASDSDFAPRGEAEMCSRVVIVDPLSGYLLDTRFRCVRTH